MASTLSKKRSNRVQKRQVKMSNAASPPSIYNHADKRSCLIVSRMAIAVLVRWVAIEVPRSYEWMQSLNVMYLWVKFPRSLRLKLNLEVSRTRI